MIRRTALLLAVILGCAGLALADAATSDPEARFQRLSQELKLTDQQKLKVLLRMQAEDRTVHAIRESATLSEAEKDARISSVHRKAQEEIRQVLTPAQQMRLAALDSTTAASSHPPEH